MSLPLLKLGSKGSTVEYLQQRLSAKGFHLTADGDFGKKTEAAVQQFQASEGLKPDGIVGDQTWNHLTVAGRAPTPEDVLAEQRAALVAKIPKGTPPVVVRALTIACNAVGAREEPLGSNHGPDIDKFVGGYNAYWKLADGEPAQPWCAMLVASCIALALGLDPNPAWGDWKGHPWFSETGHPWGPKTPGGAFRGSTSDIEDWARTNNRWTTATPNRTTAKHRVAAGSYFTMARATSGSGASGSTRAGHTGFILCDNGDGTVTTVEGNVSDSIGSKVRKKEHLRGWASWW